MTKLFTADFETTTDVNDTRVWAWAVCEINNTDNFMYGNDIKTFIEFCSDPKNNYTLYFHNMKFDGEFIFSYLLSNGFTCIKDKKDKKDKTFTCLISDMGQFYSCEIYFSVKKTKVNKVTIYDSLKILNFSVDKIAKDFHLPISKLKLNYTDYREIGHILTQNEIDYIKNDVLIMALALGIMFNLGHVKMTIGSDALTDYKSICKNFKNYFPILALEIDKEIRASYKGGFTYLNPIYKDKETKSGIVFDKNSMYPAKMCNEYLPFGTPIYFNGKYKYDSKYPLYIACITCSFELKQGKIPSIQIKNDLHFLPNEYLDSSNNEIVVLWLTNIDLELFLENYNVYDFEYIGGWKFRQIKGVFTEYIEKWTKEKIQAKKDGNGAMYTISKLFLNSLYGKFGLNPRVCSKYPVLDNGIIKYKSYDDEYRDPIYVAIASFITSYARADIIRSSEAIREYSINKYGYDAYVYS